MAKTDKKTEEFERAWEDFLKDFRAARRACRKEAKNRRGKKMLCLPGVAHLTITAYDGDNWRAWEEIKLYVDGSCRAEHGEPTLTLCNSVFLSDDVIAAAILQVLTSSEVC